MLSPLFFSAEKTKILCTSPIVKGRGEESGGQREVEKGRKGGREGRGKRGRGKEKKRERERALA